METKYALPQEHCHIYYVYTRDLAPALQVVMNYSSEMTSESKAAYRWVTKKDCNCQYHVALQ